MKAAGVKAAGVRAKANVGEGSPGLAGVAAVLQVGMGPYSQPKHTEGKNPRQHHEDKAQAELCLTEPHRAVHR